MRTLTKTLAVLSCVAAATVLVGFQNKAPKAGDTAPNFTASDAAGKSVSLDKFRGKFVVLEWSNYECPFVKKHYSVGNMQALQEKYTKKGVVWLKIFSSAPGKQGYYEPAEMLERGKNVKSFATHHIPDPKGVIGRLYDAKTTPQMVVIDPKGTIIFEGGIDDKPSANSGDIASSRNHVAAALDEAMAGREVSVKAARPYGCSVKYSE